MMFGVYLRKKRTFELHRGFQVICNTQDALPLSKKFRTVKILHIYYLSWPS